MSANVFQDGSAATEAQATPRRKSRSLVSSLPGGGKATCAFLLSLIAYTMQTEFAQYLQQSLNYRKPFLSLYLGHSGFVLLFPMHLLFLRWTTSHPTSHYLHLIAQNLRWQLETETAALPGAGPDAVRRRLSSASGRGTHIIDSEQGIFRRPISFLEQKAGFNVLKLAGLFAILTIGITIPALSWYSAVPMTSMADITAIYNTFSVWALVFSVWFLGEKWEKRKVFSVLLACFGVVIVAYGGVEHRRKPKPLDPVHGKPPPSDDHTVALIARLLKGAAEDAFVRRDPKVIVSGNTGNPVLGDLLAFFGAVTMAAYEMAFKLLGTLPDESKQREQYSAVPGSLARRSRSYVRYFDESPANTEVAFESQGLLNNATEADEDAGERHAPQMQHVLGGDEDEGDGLYKIGGSVADKLMVQDRTDYHSITPPPERDSFSVEEAAKPKTYSKALDDGVRVLAKRVSLEQKANDDEQSIDETEDEQVTESEVEDAEVDLVQSGATRLQRTRSQLSTHRLSSVGEASQAASTSRPSQSRNSSFRPKYDPSIPPPLPFGLHANIMTAGIGLTTLSTFWIGIPIANALGWEPFELPHNLWTCFALMMVVICGVFFNAAFMILLSLWGPVLASVSCLMTTILVEFADVLLGHKLKWVSVLGCTFIGAGFAVLVGGDVAH